MTEPQEDPRVGETEPTTSTLDEVVSRDDADRPNDVETVTNSGDDERGEP